ncbi:Mn2+/Fe2+ NRAMP family transporter [Lewinella marina]|uniref:Iron transporter n=1 Tax=Neolewinella marina TaxID=438751 RepID=A0A2G0CG70_9BACT|nr:Nramp family divalent metal transporter [Neolewinella marina]NJB86562.1 Mn2+/Fe2+ NRAMP family transporter [Neolewinella marina]PHK98985.1 iron transporter [Neolewinella marina]
MPKLPSLSAGLLVAATGVGAGDLVISSLSGARYGLTLLWAIAVGAVLKFALNEGLARWELATNTTLLEGWVERLPRIVALTFGVYLCFWALLVAGTLISYNGVVANSIFPLPFSEKTGATVWGAIQSVLGLALVRWGGYRGVEKVMKGVIALLFAVVIGCAVVVAPSYGAVVSNTFIPTVPGTTDGLLFSFALVGAVGGTLTIMCYAYWLREKRQLGDVRIGEIRMDLGVAYVLTALFGMAVTVIAAGVRPEAVGGYALVTSIAGQLATVMGQVGYWSFLVGFWAAVLTSMVGVYSGVPYLFADLWGRYRKRYANIDLPAQPLRQTPAYRWFLLYLALPPILLTVFQRPAWIAIVYAVSGAAFMPFLALTLLYMNNQSRWLGSLRNGWITNTLLGICLLLFLVLLGVQLEVFG